jgi:Mrp family chromosome partitioning ATPase
LQEIGRQMITMTIRWLPLIVVTTLAAGGIAFVYASSQDDVYEATGTLRVDAGPSATTQQYDAARAALAVYALDGGSSSVVQAAIDDLGLDAEVRDIQERVFLTTDDEDLTLEISAQADDPNEARLIAQRTGNVLRKSVNAALITDQVRAADDAIRANQRLIVSYTKRLNALRRKQPKTDDDRAEMLSLSSLIPTLRAENIRLEPSSREWVRNRLKWIDSPGTAGASTNRPLYWTLLALVVGGMLGAALAFVLDSLRHNDRVRDIRDLQEATGLSALGSVSERRGDISRGPAERLVVLRYPGSDPAKAYRGLLTKIGFAAPSARSLMVASHDGSDSASVVAANIAFAYADAGRTALLVDADYRAPRLHELFGVVNDRGLTDLLVNRNMPLGFVTKPSPHPRLGLMLAGPPPSTTAEALRTPVLNVLLRRLLHAADVVVFASPSTAANLDVTTLADVMDECVLVVQAGARVDDVIDAAARLERSRVHFTGAVLYRQVRGAHPRRAAVTLTQPQVQWVPRADPEPDELRLMAGAPPPARTAAPEARAGGVQQPASAWAPLHAPGQEEQTHRSTSSRSPTDQTVPIAPVPPGFGNGHGTGDVTIPRDHPAVARPGPAPPGQGPMELPRAGPQPTRDAGRDGRTGEDFVAVDGRPYSAPFDPNPPKSTNALSKS